MINPLRGISAQLGAAALPLALLSNLILGVASVQAQTPEMVDRLTQRWLDSEAQRVRLNTDWQAQKPLLEQRLGLLAAEKLQLQAMLQSSSDSQQGVEAKRAQLLAEQAELEQQQQVLNQHLELLLARTAALAPLLPPPLAEQWLTEQSAPSEQPEASQQLQSALAQLSRLAEFDARITVQEGLVSLPDVGELLVKQLYLGVGAAWFVSADGQYRGWGQALDEAWVWRPDEQVSSREISRAIAMFERREQAEFVRLPMRLVSVDIPTGGQESTREVQP
ncbi:DUF3450 family protein [Simiduia curdlanivorans]|uniref:DUF3450 family protein n=1 Tax=Simiduia curdlanivorans TaxID=1492769 RepID=A0ABV8V1B6_9GAMM|nr:DUF3450 family protein [Simiduia curdlanivorans]MDN3637480.1 DUF3450 family protein [Simiduia curdlanivorans]